MNALVHIGITVTDIEKICDFYTKYFGFEKGYGAFFDDGFFAVNKALFGQPAGVCSDMQMIISPNGVMLELFRFSNVEKGKAVKWQKTGYNHIALRVDDLPGTYEQMRADGVEFFTPPQIRSDGSGYWVYLKDPEGNLLELWD